MIAAAPPQKTLIAITKREKKKNKAAFPAAQITWVGEGGKLGGGGQRREKALVLGAL
jgi:hypothetical protein